MRRYFCPVLAAALLFEGNARVSEFDRHIDARQQADGPSQVGPLLESVQLQIRTGSRSRARFD
ncbi:MAG TPA: hypothetical protein VJT81_06320 [Burkholderiales bacterium]|nr:hypothetical protein [Burkholderiales bacterium]